MDTHDFKVNFIAAVPAHTVTTGSQRDSPLKLGSLQSIVCGARQDVVL